MTNDEELYQEQRTGPTKVAEALWRLDGMGVWPGIHFGGGEYRRVVHLYDIRECSTLVDIAHALCHKGPSKQRGSLRHRRFTSYKGLCKLCLGALV